jgi:hypothetical protein
LPTIQSILQKYGDRLWGKYGLYDSFNPTAKWFDDDYLGIDQGPLLIMIENFRTGLVWDYMMKDPVIQQGLSRLGFEYLKGPLPVDGRLAADGIEIKNFNGSQLPAKVTINGVASQDLNEKEFRIREIPAAVAK